MNKVILIGRLTRDPDVRMTQSGTAVTTFTLAVDRRRGRNAEQNGQPTADFIPIVTWDKLAEICGNNLSKGQRVGIEGRMQIRSYDAQDGTKRYVAEVVANELEFLSPKNSAPQEGAYGESYAAPAPAAPVQPAGDTFGPAIPDEDIPF